MIWFLVAVAIWVVAAALIWGWGERQFFNKTGIRYVKAEEIVENVLSRRNCSNLATLKDWVLKWKMGSGDPRPGSDFEILIIENYDPEEWQIVAILWPIFGLYNLLNGISKAWSWFWKNAFSRTGSFIFKILKIMFLAVSEIVMLGTSQVESEAEENNLKGPYR